MGLFDKLEKKFNKGGESSKSKEQDEHAKPTVQRTVQRSASADLLEGEDSKVGRIEGLEEEQQKQLEEILLKNRQRIEPLDKSARFSYGGIVACHCPMEKSEDDREWSMAFCERLWEHLDLTEGQRMGLRVFAEGELEREATPFEEHLLAEEFDAVRWIIWQDLLEMSIIDGIYDARARVLAFELTNGFSIPATCVEEFEYSISEALLEANAETEEERIEREKDEKKKKKNRWLKVTAAAVGGGALIGLTGGLAAPFVAAGAGAVVGAGAGAALASAGGIALMTTLFGVAGAGIGGYKMKKRVGELKEFEIQTVSENSRLHAKILVSGWIDDVKESYSEPWRLMRDSGDIYSVRWESEMLCEVSTGLKDLIKSGAITFAAQEALKQTLLVGVMVALTFPLALLSASAIIDNPWSMTANRAKDAGQLLASLLLQRVHGNRPVVLMGYCFGAAVIYHCLLELARVTKKKRKNLGIVQDVYLLGAPIPVDEDKWRIMNSVIAGKIYNGYSKTDWLLKFVYRAVSAKSKLAGLEPLEFDFVTNIDLTDIVEKTSDYKEKLPYILDKLGFLSEDADLPPLKDMGDKTESPTAGKESDGQATGDTPSSLTKSTSVLEEEKSHSIRMSSDHDASHNGPKKTSSKPPNVAPRPAPPRPPPPAGGSN
eukprot:Nk52_evm47s236 gene=Nk52_evmTU47s236